MTSTFAAGIATAARQGYISTPRQYGKGRRSTASTGASERQITLILTLVTERADTYMKLGQPRSAQRIRDHIASFDFTTMADPSAAITCMIATNKALKAAVPVQKANVLKIAEAVTTGMYHYEDKNYRVRESKAGRLYAEEAVSTKQNDGTFKTQFIYARGVITKLTGDHRMTAEQAKAHGAYFGTCVCCGKTLTNEVSIDRMVGPICWDKHFG